MIELESLVVDDTLVNLSAGVHKPVPGLGQALWALRHFPKAFLSCRSLDRSLKNACPLKVSIKGKMGNIVYQFNVDYELVVTPDWQVSQTVIWSIPESSSPKVRFSSLTGNLDSEDPITTDQGEPKETDPWIYESKLVEINIVKPILEFAQLADAQGFIIPELRQNLRGIYHNSDDQKSGYNKDVLRVVDKYLSLIVPKFKESLRLSWRGGDKCPMISYLDATNSMQLKQGDYFGSGISYILTLLYVATIVIESKVPFHYLRINESFKLDCFNLKQIVQDLSELFKSNNVSLYLSQ